MPDPAPTRIPTVCRERRDDENLVHTGFSVYSEIRYSISDSNEAHQWLIRPCEPTSWRLLFFPIPSMLSFSLRIRYMRFLREDSSVGAGTEVSILGGIFGKELFAWLRIQGRARSPVGQKNRLPCQHANPTPLNYIFCSYGPF